MNLGLELFDNLIDDIIVPTTNLVVDVVEEILNFIFETLFPDDRFAYWQALFAANLPKVSLQFTCLFNVTANFLGIPVPSQFKDPSALVTVYHAEWLLMYDFIKLVEPLVSGILALFYTLVEQIISIIKSPHTFIFNFVKKLITMVLHIVVEVAVWVFEVIIQTIVDIFEFIINAIKAVVDAIYSLVSTIYNWVKAIYDWLP